MPYKGIHHFFRIVTYDGVPDSGQITVLGSRLGFVAGFKGKYQFPVTGIPKFFRQVHQKGRGYVVSFCKILNRHIAVFLDVFFYFV